MARRNPVAQVGNYAAPAESTGDPAMDQTLFGGMPKPLDKTENDYVSQAKNKATAKVAVQRARKANKQPPPPEDL
jgi:hypothetical protein